MKRQRHTENINSATKGVFLFVRHSCGSGIKLKINCITSAPIRKYIEAEIKFSEFILFFSFFFCLNFRLKSKEKNWAKKQLIFMRNVIVWHRNSIIERFTRNQSVYCFWHHVCVCHLMTCHTLRICLRTANIRTHTRARLRYERKNKIKEPRHVLNKRSHSRSHSLTRLCLGTVNAARNIERKKKKLSQCKLYTNLFDLMSSIYSANPTCAIGDWRFFVSVEISGCAVTVRPVRRRCPMWLRRWVVFDVVVAGNIDLT